MITLRLALRNVLGAGIRTWLNVISLSLAFVAIIFLQGLYNGMSRQVETASMAAQYAGGHYWQANYDPYDPLTLEDAHAALPAALNGQISRKRAVPILVRPATIYPNGRFQNVLLKGIPPNQSVLTIPTHAISTDEAAIPALIGQRMARSAGLKKGDYVTARWRDAGGTFDADEILIVEVMQTDVSGIDNGQMWIPLEKLRSMTAMPGEATLVVLEKGSTFKEPVAGWTHRDLEFLLKDLRALFLSKSIGGSIFYIVLLLLAMLAIFNTQVLAVFRRRKEMGTLMALGMTRGNVIGMFTLEGATYALLAAAAAAVYGLPLLLYMAANGFGLPEATDNFGLAIGNRIFPTYSAGLVLGTTLLVLLVTTVVSYLPTRKIAKLKPTDALRGNLT